MTSPGTLYPLPPLSLTLAGLFFDKGFLQNSQLVRAPYVSMPSYVGTKLGSDLHIKKIIRASTASQLSTKLYSRIARHRQSANQEA